MSPRHLAFAGVWGLSACVAMDQPVVTEPPPEPPRAKVTAPAPEKPEPPAPAPAVVQPAPVATASEIEALVADFQRLRRLPPAELAREQESARQAFSQSRADAARIRLAMAIALPGGQGEEARALELLEPLVKSPATHLHGFAFMIASYLQEQRRLAAQLQGAQQNVNSLQQNMQALQQKLDALKTLERSLSERGETVAPRKR
jgi:hypothetical protein